MTSESSPVVNVSDDTKVDHNYHDYSHVTMQEEAAIQPLLQMGTEDQQSAVAGTSTFSDRNFPAKLHFVLGELERDGMADICGWQPHGRCFIVHQAQPFIELVLRKWFRQTKFASFQRQLNIYGFSRITFGPDKNAYYNEFFLRGKPFLATRIPRLKVKGTGPRRPSSYKTEPNFYSMPFLPMVDNGAPRRGSSAATARSQQQQQLAAAQRSPQVDSVHPMYRNIQNNSHIGPFGGVGPVDSNIEMLLKSAPGQGSATTPLQAFLQSRRESTPMLMVPKSNPSRLLPPDTLAEHVLSLSHHRMADPPAASFAAPPPQAGLSQYDLARAIFMQSIASRRQSEAAVAAAAQAASAANAIDPRVLAMAQDLYAQRRSAQMPGEDAGGRSGGYMDTKAWLEGGPRR